MLFLISIWKELVEADRRILSVLLAEGAYYQHRRWVAVVPQTQLSGGCNWLLQSVDDHGNLSSHKVCLSPLCWGWEPRCTGSQGDDVSTEEVRTSTLSARARQRTMDRPSIGQTVCPFSGGSVFDASLLHEIARNPGAQLENWWQGHSKSVCACTQYLWVPGGYPGLKWWRWVPRGGVNGNT